MGHLAQAQPVDDQLPELVDDQPQPVAAVGRAGHEALAHERLEEAVHGRLAQAEPAGELRHAERGLAVGERPQDAQGVVDRRHPLLHGRSVGRPPLPHAVAEAPERAGDTAEGQDGRVSGSHGHGGHGHGGHDHGVSAAGRAGARHQRALLVSFFLIVGFLVVQVVVGIATGSLALLSDAGHMATDALGLGMALAAIHAASASRTNPQRTFGLYRLEILAALANAVLLFGVAAYVLYEAVIRLGEDREIASLPVLIVGVLGLAVNVVAFLLLREGAKESLNVEGAYVEVMSDALGSLGVIVGAIVWGATGWTWVDPVIGAAIGLFILPRAFRLGREAVRILVQAAPERIDVPALRADLAGIPGVVDVHDLHVWTLTSDMEVASAHLMVRIGTDSHGVLDQARALLEQRHGLGHATLQIEPEDHRGCDEINW